MKIAICTAGYGMMSDNVVFPMLNAIYKSYPNSSLFMRNFVVSGAGIVSIIFGLLTGFLTKYISKKKLLVWGTIIFAVGGIGGAFSTSIEFLALTRAIDAASDGILTAVTAAMIVDLWHDKHEQSEMISFYNVASNLFGVVMSITAGYAAVKNWHFAFFINSIALVSTILCVLFVPDTGVDTAEEAQEEEEDYFEQSGQKWSPCLIILALVVYCIAQSCNYMPSFLIDLLVVEKKLGDSVLSGYSTSILTISGIAAFLTATPALMKRKNPRHFAVAVFALEIAGMICYGFGRNIVMMLVAAVFNGFAGSWIIVYFEMYVARNTPKRVRGMWIAVTTSLIYFDGILAPYVPNIMKFLFHVDSINGAVITSAIIILAILIIYIILIFHDTITKKPQLSI